MKADLFKMDLAVDDEALLKKNKMEKKIKRAADFAISILLLIIVCPLLVCACIAIRIESKGSAIYRQKRYGFCGREFIAYKLRTMYEHSSDGNLAAPKAGDTRVTRVGKILRKTSIDELPQLFNVLHGDMSILGPRAVPYKEIELRLENMIKSNPEQEGQFRRAMEIRMLMRPGISGMAQAYGRSALTAKEATGYDVYYVMYYSLLLDIRIFFKTIDTILFRKGVN